MTFSGKIPRATVADVDVFCLARDAALVDGDAAVRAWCVRYGMDPPTDPAEFRTWVGIHRRMREARLTHSPGPRLRAPAAFLQPDLFEKSDPAANGAHGGSPVQRRRHRTGASRMDMSKYGQTKFLKADDIEGPLTLTIAAVGRGKGFDGDERAKLTFRDSTKELTLNPTNARALTRELGRDSDLWVGRRIECYLSPEGWLRVRALTKELDEEETPF